MRDNQFAKDCGKIAEKTKGIKEIKPCPFCGGKADYKDIGFLFKKEHLYAVSCSVCGSATPVNEDLIQAIKSWNKRVNVAKRGCK